MCVRTFAAGRITTEASEGGEGGKGRWEERRSKRKEDTNIENGEPPFTTQAASQRATQRRGEECRGSLKYSRGGGQASFCASLGYCVYHMGKHDEAVTGTLCVVDLDA